MHEQHEGGVDAEGWAGLRHGGDGGGVMRRLQALGVTAGRHSYVSLMPLPQVAPVEKLRELGQWIHGHRTQRGLWLTWAAGWSTLWGCDWGCDWA